MKIKETRAGFTKIINPGKFAFFINLDKYGVDLDVDRVIEQAKYFPHIIIQGGEIFEQKEDIYKLVKRVAKENPYITFEAHTTGTIKPLGLASLNNVEYYVNVQLKNSNIPYSDRIKDNVIAWFNESDGKFIFYIQNNDDLDEMDMLINALGIKKSQVYVMPNNNKQIHKDYINILKRIIVYCKIRGYNYSFDFNRMMKVVESE